MCLAGRNQPERTRERLAQLDNPLMETGRLNTRTLRLHGFILALALLPAQNLMAQIESATISGLVLDSSGLPIPAAMVAAKETTTNVGRETIASATGFYTIPF